ncbi:hypothetical protein KKC60_05855, partial [Patescibacteria group bacterium]|nr:hypothetical protein [Patescibacteria group bacterium]
MFVKTSNSITNNTKMRGAEKRNIINGDQITPQELSQEFLDTANKASEEEEHKRYAEIGLEVAEQNFHKAQGLMERSVMWDDGNREMAVKVNRYSQEKEGTVPPNLNEAFQSIAGYA